ncbi:ICE-like protease (caspase) p20 domain protein [Rhizoctonia solani]|uniref:ICE-like protease (Caspase) p20 domain protein n=1 Tax=Rhizoctonia solani TaxID=456999 RepID=A0A8H7LG68_9AGAM|nr:ICE-like protease (caspase) p20 domain protein [Rhizoctonia solani]KAF8669740.1 hypothetical protein RHS04_08751 [Rhizoctonia solani]QRW19929.1 ICE-like protease (caspase) p20 domain protein [Rhizoctonia solani]
MSLYCLDAPVAKGRKSNSVVRWIDVLPAGPYATTSGQEVSIEHPVEAESEPPGSWSGGVTVDISPPSELPRLQSNPRSLHPQLNRPEASWMNTPRSQTPSNALHRTLIRPQSPARSGTPPARSRTPILQVPSGRQRPTNILVPSRSPNLSTVTAYNPADTLRHLDLSTPISQGRRNAHVHSSSGMSFVSGSASRGSLNSYGESVHAPITRCPRGLLIIGSSHREPHAYMTDLAPLMSTHNDRNRLRTAFQSRRYSVETMVEHEGNKGAILRRVGNFLASAEAGDIRMIVFTGHGTKIGEDRQFAIIPSQCASDNDTISSAEWQSTILESAGAGVVVVSVFAACMSGGMISGQAVKLTNFERIIDSQSSTPTLPSGPIQIILSSSGDNQSSFEYRTPPHTPSDWHDYFLWALAETARRPEVDSWESFLTTLQATFTYVRAVGLRSSSYEYPRDLDWLLQHPQTPRIYVSSQVPDFNQFMPPQGY